MKRNQIVSYLDSYLMLDNAPADPSNNGLQVEGKNDIRKIVFGVDASLELFKKAAEAKADMIMVHHGISWKDSLKYIDGMNAARLKELFLSNTSLYAAHLPLDAHPESGNNAGIAAMLGITGSINFGCYAGIKIGFSGDLPKGLDNIEKIARKLQDSGLKGTHKIFGDRSQKLKSAGVISGGSWNEAYEEAAANGLDCFITGEVEHQAYHVIKESGLTVLSLGHYMSETVGVKLLMQKLKEEFNVETEFIDIPTGL